MGAKRENIFFLKLNFNVFFLEKKCMNMTMSEIEAPIAVASPAPSIPMSV